MKISVLGSGSKGNSTYIEYNGTRILIDIGLPVTYINEKLKEINVSPGEIDAVVITHTHLDHISGLKPFCKRYNPKVYLTKSMYQELNFEVDAMIIDSDIVVIKSLCINVIPTSHDTYESLGFIIKADKKELVYITDTGYINRNYIPMLIDKDMYVFESNHDIEKLMLGRYPYHLKQRILSDIGHLSNKDASLYLSKLVGDRTKSIILVHLSEETNCEQIALETLKQTLDKQDKKINKIIISRQKEKTELVEI